MKLMYGANTTNQYNIHKVKRPVVVTVASHNPQQVNLFLAAACGYENVLSPVDAKSM